MAWLRKLWALIRGTRLDRELDEEMEFHLAMRTEAHRAAGLDEREAQHQARRQFGNRTVLKELTHDMNVSSWLQQFVQVISFTHLRYAWRLLWRAPALSWGAVLSLALGVGAATALFSIVDAVLLKPLPYRDADRLVTIALAFPPDTNTASSELARRLLAGREASARRLLYELTAEDVRAVQARTDLFESVATVVLADHSLDVSDRALSDTDATVLRGGLADQRLFGTLGIRAALGRTFQEDDAQRDVVVISDSVWKSHFGADPAVVGRPLRLAKGPRTIIGVLPAGIHLTYPEETEFWLPLSPVFVQGQRNGNPFSVIARLRPKVSVSQASAALDIGTIGLTLGPVRRPTAPHVEVQPLHEQVSGSARPALVLALLLGSIGTWATVMAAVTERVREMGIRSALGATSRELVRFAMRQAVKPIVVGIAIGTIGAFWTARLLTRFLFEVSVRDPLSFGTAVVLVVVVALFAAWLPSRAAVRLNPLDALRQQ